MTVTTPTRTWLVQHRRRARRDEVPTGPESAAEVSATPFWSVWSQRHYPWALLDDGTQVLLLDSWSSGSILTWRVEAYDVLRAEIGSRGEAVERLAHWSGEDADSLAASRYLQGSGVDAGVVLGWRARPLAWLGCPRPSPLRLDRHGWAAVRDEDLRSWEVLPEGTLV